MKNNLVLYPSKKFILNDCENIFVDIFTLFQFNQKKFSSFDYEYVKTKTDIEYKKKNFILSDKIYNEILISIKNEFNKINKKNFDTDFYQIIIGPWLRFFVYQFVNKYKTMVEVINNYNVEKCTIYDSKKLLFYVDDSASFHHAPNNNNWN